MALQGMHRVSLLYKGDRISSCTQSLMLELDFLFRMRKAARNVTLQVMEHSAFAA